MTTIQVDISEEIQKKFWISNHTSFETLISKTLWEDFISPDLTFTSFENMNETHKKLSESVNKNSKLLNI